MGTAHGPSSITAGLSPLAHDLCDHALLRGSFTLRSGLTSDRYFDKYRVSTHPGLLARVANALNELIERACPDAEVIVAPELGAVPIATATALARTLPFVIIRGQRKAYGTSHQIEGVVTPGQHGVLLEDVVTSGGAAIEALHAARDAGLIIDTSICILDRDGGGADALAREGAPLHALMHARELDAAYDIGLGMPAAQ